MVRWKKAKTITVGLGSKAPVEVFRGTVKYVELYGEVSSIGANAEATIINWTVPDGHCAELFAVGVIPDYDPDTGASNLDGVYIKADGKAIPHSNFSANHNGKNFLPFGDRACRRPLFIFDRPLVPRNLTYKFNEGDKIQIVGKAGSTAVSKPVRVRASVFLLEPEDVRRIYGVDINKFATLPGGHQQEKPILLFAEYYDNPKTSGKSKFEALAEIPIKTYEQVQLRMIGVAPHDNADALKLVDHRTKKEFPEYEPYWKINSLYNMLPFGDDEDFQGAVELPAPVKEYIWTNTTLKIMIRDNGTAIPEAGVRVQLIGMYKQV